MEGFTIRICEHKYLWEGLIIVVNMMKSYRITYSIYIMSYKNADGKYRAVVRLGSSSSPPLPRYVLFRPQYCDNAVLKVVIVPCGT